MVRDEEPVNGVSNDVPIAIGTDMVRDEEPGNGVSNDVPTCLPGRQARLPDRQVASGSDTLYCDDCQSNEKFKKFFENMV